MLLNRFKPSSRIFYWLKYFTDCSWLSFVVSNCEFVTFPLVSWVGCGTWLYRLLIFAPLLTLGCWGVNNLIFWPWSCGISNKREWAEAEDTLKKIPYKQTCDLGMGSKGQLPLGFFESVGICDMRAIECVLVVIQNIDCGYLIELHQWGSSDEYPHSLFYC